MICYDIVIILRDYFHMKSLQWAQNASPVRLLLFVIDVFCCSHDLIFNRQLVNILLNR